MILNKDYMTVLRGGKNVREAEDVYRKESSLYWIVFAVGFVMALILLLGIVLTVFAEEYDADRIVDAIYLVEGAEKAKKPFGILSVPCDGYEDCRQVCYNTVVNSFSRWQVAGSKGDFLEYLGRRYAPPQAHPLNRNWVPNIKKLLAKK